MREFKFVVIPGESWEDEAARWDKQLNTLQDQGFTISGTGPDGDDPIRQEFVDPADLAGPFVSFYNVVPL